MAKKLVSFECDGMEVRVADEHLDAIKQYCYIGASVIHAGKAADVTDILKGMTGEQLASRLQAALAILADTGRFEKFAVYKMAKAGEPLSKGQLTWIINTASVAKAESDEKARQLALLDGALGVS